MSLLNDALRGAEQRRERPAASVYTGGGVTTKGASSHHRLALWLMLALFLLLSLVAWFWWSQNRTLVVPTPPVADSVVVREPVPTATRERTERQAAEPAAQSEPQLAVTPAPAPEAVIAEARTEPAENPVPEVPRAAPEPVAKPPVVDAASVRPAPEPKAQVAAPAKPVAAPMEPEAGGATPAAPEPSEAELAAVKQQAETPEMIDRRTDAEIKRLLARGRLAEAEERLGSVLADQSAPISRARLARHLIIANQPARALSWLPESVTPGEPELRLLRARAQLAEGDAQASLATLEDSVPAVSQHPEYLVTLAALLQQEGRANDAVGRWAELVAYNDSQAAWWVGLASALEADRQTGGAQRAYQQALALADLSPTLADFCRQRLRALGAG